MTSCGSRIGMGENLSIAKIAKIANIAEIDFLRTFDAADCV
jgi:hypothetical protein